MLIAVARSTNNIVIDYNSGHVVGEHIHVKAHNAPAKVGIVEVASFQFPYL